MAKDDREQNIQRVGFIAWKVFPDSNSDPWHNYREGKMLCSYRGDFKKWKNISDIELVTFHKWIEERIPIKSYDETLRLVTLSRKSTMALNDDFEGKYPRYYVENVFEVLVNPVNGILTVRLGKFNIFHFRMKSLTIRKYLLHTLHSY